jgi:hypothetical protein
MNEHSTSLAARLEKLEQENRRMKRVGGALLGAIGVVALCGAAAPAFCKTVWAERLVLRDSSGRDRMTMDAYSSSTPSITMRDAKGESVVRLSWKDGVLMDMLDAKGKSAATVKIDREGRTTVVRGEQEEGEEVSMAK